jgi:hypothetical protein
MALVYTTRKGEQYETVAASQTAQVLGTVGAVGDMIDRIIITPSNATTGVVTLLDNATSIPIHPGGAATPLLPIVVELGMKSVSGAWKITTGAAVTVIAVGRFT